MFEFQAQIIEYHEKLINQVDIFFEEILHSSNYKPNLRQTILQKIKEISEYNLRIKNSKYKYCYFFGKIDKLFLKLLSRNEIGSELSEFRVGLLLIINEMIPDKIYGKLIELLNNCEEYDVMDYKKFDSLETITKVGVIHQLMIENFNHPIIDLTNNSHLELKRVEMTFINNDLNEKNLEFLPKYLNIEKIDEILCHSDTTLCLENIPSEFFNKIKFITKISFSCCIINKLISHNFVCIENLIFLQLFHCSIKTIEPNAFYGLKKLQSLLITESYLKYLDPKVFYGLENLNNLNLDANLLEKIEGNNFVHLKNLKHLTLTTNCIQELDKDCFNGLDNLKILRLSYNKRYIVLNTEIFKPIPNIGVLYLNSMYMEIFDQNIFKYLTNLKFLDLSDNTIGDASILNHLINLEALNIHTYQDLTNIEKLRLKNLRVLVINQCENFKLGLEFENLQILKIDHFSGFEENFFENLKSLEFLEISPQDYSIIENVNSNDFKLANKLKYLHIEIDDKSVYTKIEAQLDFFKSLFDSSLEITHKMFVHYSNLNLEKKSRFKTEKEAVDYAININFSAKCLGVISFINQDETNFIYKIRLSHSPRNNPGLSAFSRERDWKTNVLYPFFPVLGPRNKDLDDGGSPGYFSEGFLSLQKSIDFNLLNTFNDSAASINLNLNRFPYPPYNNDPFVAIIQALFPFIIMLSFIFTVILTAKAIVAEKESGIKEGMKLMGMKPWIYWLSWYIKTMGVILPAIIFIVVSFKIPLTVESGAKASIIDKTDPFLFFLFLILYASSSVTLTFVCTTFFKKANSGAAGAGVIWFFSYLPYIFISLRYEKMTLGLKVISCFVNNLAMSLGIQLIGMFEGKGTGIDFSNWNEGLSVDDTFSLLNVMIIMLANNFINLILLYYFDNVLPGDRGISK
ncbi:ATP-binding cassette sub-family A member 3, partial [Brachionus plicatilis]